MQWDDFRRSDNVEESSGGGGFGGGGMRLGGGAIVVVVVVSLLLGKNPLEMLALLGDGGSPTVQTQTQAPTSPSGPADRSRQADGFRGARARRYRGRVGRHLPETRLAL